MGLIHNQLALWEFYTANYAAATGAATAAHKVWVSVGGRRLGGWGVGCRARRAEVFAVCSSPIKALTRLLPLRLYCC